MANYFFPIASILLILAGVILVAGIVYFSWERRAIRRRMATTEKINLREHASIRHEIVMGDKALELRIDLLEKEA